MVTPFGSFSAGRSKAALSANCIRKLIGFLKIRNDIGGYNELSYSLARGNGLGDIAVIVQSYHYLASVIAVNDTDLVCGRETAL